MWIKEQHNLIYSADRCVLRQSKKTAKQSASAAGGKHHKIPVGNLVSLMDHPKGCNKIQYNYVFIVCHGTLASGPQHMSFLTNQW